MASSPNTRTTACRFISAFRAHEDDAERAVRAGLAVVEAVSGSGAAGPLGVRIGIATGLVVVGDLIGKGASQEEAVVGDCRRGRDWEDGTPEEAIEERTPIAGRLPIWRRTLPLLATRRRQRRRRFAGVTSL
jgi:hypothetical protein